MKEKTTWEEEEIRVGFLVLFEQEGHCFCFGTRYEKLIWCFSYFSHVVVMVWLIKKKKKEEPIERKE